MEDKCVFCESFAIFKELMLSGHSMEDAYHTVTSNMVREVIEDITEESFNEGYITAMHDVRSMSDKVINQFNECECDEDCSDCN